jgi:hypothetical protein
MRSLAIAAGILAIGMLAAPAWAVKKVPYPEVPVTALPVFAGDPALAEMRKQLAKAAAAEDLEATLKLLAPEFTWTADDGPADEFDPKRDAEHNFKVAFGFRPVGGDADGKTDIGPQWGLLSYFATDEVLTQEQGSPLVCGSTTAKVADLGALDEAFDRIDEEDDISEWVYFLGELELTAKPGAGAAVARLRNLALPIVGLHPAPKSDTAHAAAPTHFELLLPTGKSGWAEVKQVRPLFVDRLCFAKIGNDWKIARFDQAL